MLSRRAEETRVRRFGAPKQFMRHAFARPTNDDEWFVKVFNRTVENFVEKNPRQTRFARQH
jgi:hypothetical protein